MCRLYLLQLQDYFLRFATNPVQLDDFFVGLENHRLSFSCSMAVSGRAALPAHFRVDNVVLQEFREFAAQCRKVAGILTALDVFVKELPVDQVGGV